MICPSSMNCLLRLLYYIVFSIFLLVDVTKTPLDAMLTFAGAFILYFKM